MTQKLTRQGVRDLGNSRRQNKNYDEQLCSQGLHQVAGQKWEQKPTWGGYDLMVKKCATCGEVVETYDPYERNDGY